MHSKKLASGFAKYAPNLKVENSVPHARRKKCAGGAVHWQFAFPYVRNLRRARRILRIATPRNRVPALHEVKSLGISELVLIRFLFPRGEAPPCRGCPQILLTPGFLREHHKTLDHKSISRIRVAGTHRICFLLTVLVCTRTLYYILWKAYSSENLGNRQRQMNNTFSNNYLSSVLRRIGYWKVWQKVQRCREIPGSASGFAALLWRRLGGTANPRTENLDIRGFDSIVFLFIRGGFPLNELDSPKV